MSKFSIKNLFAIAVLAACLAPQMVRAGLDGEPAPALNIGQWLKGQPVEIKPGTNVYVVEIWNSSSALCRAVVTNLNAIQKRYQDQGLVVVAVSDEPIIKLKNFMARTNLEIDYTVASDNKRFTSLTYMNPVMQRGIPYAFVVGTNGDLLWHGPPARSLDHALELIMAGKFDEALAKKDDLDNHQLQQYLNLARQGSDRTKMAGPTLLNSRTNDVPKLCELAIEISSAPKLSIRDFALADQALKEAESLTVTNSAAVAIARAIWLFESGKQDEGLARANDALSYTQDPMLKTNVEMCIQVMEKRRAAGTHQGAPTPNATTAPGPGAGAGSNQGASGGSAPAGNP